MYREQTIEADVSFNVSLGMKKLHKHFDVELNIEKGGEKSKQVILKGALINIGKLNEAAKKCEICLNFLSPCNNECLLQ